MAAGLTPDGLTPDGLTPDGRGPAGIKPGDQTTDNRTSSQTTADDLVIGTAPEPPRNPPTDKPLAGRIALVTGASRGIGAATARLLAAKGAHVILTARTLGGLEEVDDAIKKDALTTQSAGSATLSPFNLRDFDLIDQMGAALAQRYGRLDILVANAAVLGALSPVGHMPLKLWQELWDVNVTANWRLIRSLDPLLRRSDAGRAVFTTCTVNRCAAANSVKPFWGVYGASKAALETLVKTWASEQTRTNIRANLIDPGATATRLRAEAFPGEDQNKLKTPEEAASALLQLALPDCQLNGEVVGG